MKTIKNETVRSMFLAGMVFGSFAVSAEIYKWIDDNGRIHFGDQSPGIAAVEKLTVKKINSYTQVTIENKTSSSKIRSKRGKVMMYSASWCGYCKQARKYFQENRIIFKDYDIEKSEKGRREYDALGGKGVPVILVGDRRMNGFSEAGFKEIYN